MNKIEKQNNFLAKYLLDENYYQSFKQGQKTLELFLLGKCSAHCEYCYLNKHEKELYPEVEEQVILNNLKTILSWYVKNEFTCEIDIFSAEWLNLSNFRDQVFEIFYNTFKESDFVPPLILIPSNLQFIHKEENIQAVQNWIDKFKELNIPVYISGSIDGKYCDDGRTLCDDEFYVKCFNFLNKNKFLTHPMVSSSNIKNWIQNYQWWIENFPGEISEKLMTLEVRDETWTKESIQDLLNYLNYVIDYEYENFFHQDKKEFLKFILGIYNTKLLERYYKNYNIYCLLQKNVYSDNSEFTCTLGSRNLPIRVGDLSVIICHRLGYPELVLGKYILQDRNLIDFEVQNIELLIMKLNTSRKHLPHCESCKYINCCTGFCAGNSYENYKNPLIPTMEVCEMYRTKINFLICKYIDMGLFEYLPEIKDLLNEGSYNYLIDLITNVAEEVGANNE